MTHLISHRPRVSFGGVALGTAALVQAMPALACPRCAEGQAAQREVWNADFFPHLAIVLLPFVIMGAICTRAHAMGRS